MDSYDSLKATNPSVCLPEIEMFLKTQNENTIKFVSFCLRELDMLHGCNSAYWECHNPENLYSLVKVMRYLVGANAKINKVDDLDLYNVTFTWD